MDDKKQDNKKNKKPQLPKPDKNYSLIKAIRGYKQGEFEGEKALHKANVKTRNIRVRKFIEENVNTSTKSKIFPGQLIMFNYFMPKTK